MRPTCATVSTPRSAFGGITYAVISDFPTISGHSSKPAYIATKKKVKTRTHLGHPQTINYGKSFSMYEKE